MYESRAHGGPLNGVKLCAPGTWDGMLRKQGAPITAQASKYFHPGRYTWLLSDGWTWVPGTFVEITNLGLETRTWQLVTE